MKSDTTWRPHPLFQLPKLLELAERTLKNRPKEIYYDAGDVSVEQRWDAIPKKPFSAVEAMQRVETCGAWFIFRSAQNDPEYRVFLDKGLAEPKQHMGPGIDSKIMVEDIIIFVTSPKRVTTYHIDRECNFLLQIRGTKSLYVFDREDREVLPEEEMDASGPSITTPPSTSRVCSSARLPTIWRRGTGCTFR